MSIAVAGAGGRLGQLVVRALAESGDLRLTRAFESPQSRLQGQPVPGHADLRYTTLEAGGLADVAVLIDVSLPGAAATHLRAAAQQGCAVLLATTGHGPEIAAEVEAAAARVAVVQSANLSLGVNLLAGLVALASRALPGFDIEIVESHHRNKRDAPSGTALLLGRAAAAARGLGDDALRTTRSGDTGPRAPGEIGIAALRGGDVVGEHTVHFLGTGERVELSHRAQRREVFAEGAVRAARWLLARPPGRYDMQDVLGLR